MTRPDSSPDRSAVRLEHAFVYVRDLAATLPFYRDLFPDWVVRWEGQGRAGRWIHFGPSGDGQPGYLSLCEAAPAASADRDGRATAFAPAGAAAASPRASLPGRPAAPAELTIDHLGFAHPDVDGLVARLAILGHLPSDRVDDGHFRRAYFDDPDGHKLEFVERRAG